MPNPPNPKVKRISPKSTIGDGKHTSNDVYSITIRTGNGLNLGNKTVQLIEQFFEDHFDQYILAVEKKGVESHFQGGAFCDPPKRQDHIRASLNKLVLQLYTEQSDEIPSQKRLLAVSKHALKVIPHDSFKKLVTYCSKEGFFAIHRYRLNDSHTKYLHSRIYCEDHGNPLSIYHEDSVTLENPYYSCTKCPTLPWYFIKNIKKVLDFKKL